MRQIEFQVGYYEWLLLVDGETYFVIDDGIADWIDESERYQMTKTVTKDIIEEYVDMCLDRMVLEADNPDEEAQESSKEAMKTIGQLTDRELKKARKLMVEAYYYRYGDLHYGWLDFTPNCFYRRLDSENIQFLFYEWMDPNWIVFLSSEVECDSDREEDILNIWETFSDTVSDSTASAVSVELKTEQEAREFAGKYTEKENKQTRQLPLPEGRGLDL